MTKIKVKASQKAVEEAESAGDFIEAPDGYYVAKLTSVSQEESKSGNDQLVCTWKPVGKSKKNLQLDQNYGQLWDYVTLEGDSTEWKRAEFLLAIGKKPSGRAAGMDIEIDEGKPGTVIGTLALIRVKSEMYQEERKAKIAKVLPWSQEDADEADTADETDAGDEGEADALGDEGFDDGDDAVQDYEMLTKEGLLADRDALKAAAAEFGIDGKGKKLGEVINEVLAAQDAWLAEQEIVGDDDEGDAVDPEEEPF